MDLLSGRFSSSTAGTHAYGPGITDEFLVFTANVHLLVNSDGAVFIAIVNQDDGTGDHLVFDFGSYWSVSTIRRSYDSVVTLRAGRSGLVLALANASDMERFEGACDQFLPSHVAGSMQPTLEQLGELGIIAVPRLIGSFLRGDPVVQDPPASRVQDPPAARVQDPPAAPAYAPQEVELISDEEDEASVYEDATDAVSGGGGHGAHPAFLDDAEIDFVEELEALVEDAADAIRAQRYSIEDFEELEAWLDEAVREITERLRS